VIKEDHQLFRWQIRRTQRDAARQALLRPTHRVCWYVDVFEPHLLILKINVIFRSCTAMWALLMLLLLLQLLPLLLPLPPFALLQLVVILLLLRLLLPGEARVFCCLRMVHRLEFRYPYAYRTTCAHTSLFRTGTARRQKGIRLNLISSLCDRGF